MIHKFENIAIAGVAATVPKNIREIMSLNFGPPELERIVKSTGIERTRITDHETTASDLCIYSCQKLMAELKLGAEDIDALVFVSPTPDYIALTSHELHGRLGLRKSIPCFDLTFGCSGYIYGLLQASLLISAGVAKKVLLLTGETTTKLLGENDRSTLSLFGDAGAASVIEARSDSPLYISVGSDGSGFPHIKIPNSGFRKSTEGDKLIMDGAEVFAFASRVGPEITASLLKFANVEQEKIDWFLIHQANKFIVDFIASKLKLAPEKICWSLREFGNTGAASIPLTMVVDEKFRKSEKRFSMLSGFGIGLSWGGAITDLSKTCVLPLYEIN